VVQEQNSGNPATAPSAAASGSTTKKDNRSENSIDSNQKTLLDFKKSLIEEQKLGETQIEKINESIEETKKLVFYQLALSNPTYPVTINLKVKFRVFATDTGTVAGFVT